MPCHSHHPGITFDPFRVTRGGARAPRVLAATAVAALLALGAVPAAAQSCFGLPGQLGAVTFGFEGTDGATGEGMGVMLRGALAAVELSRSSLDRFAQADDVDRLAVRGSWTGGGPARVCPYLGLETTSYEAATGERRQRLPGEDGIERAEYAVIGQLSRVRVPVGLALGRELLPDRRITLTPFVAGGLLYNREQLVRPDGTTERASSLGFDASGGVTVRLGRLLVRSAVAYGVGVDYTLSDDADFAALSVRAGWAF